MLKTKIIAGLIGLLLLLPSAAVLAQAEAMVLSITPPLIKNNVNPGQIWKSSIKLVNNNPTPLTAYIRVQDFKNRADNGTVEFLDTSGESAEADSYLLSRWIDILDDSIEIPAYGSQDIPFVVAVPEDAGPGGHYAAVLAGTTPPEPAAGGSAIRVSSLLASLLLINVSGEVIEKGDIREFSTDKDLYSRPEVKFTVRFENQGNTHIQPQGEIAVTNLINKEKGVITINHGKETGNVLPGENRRWEFEWQGEAGLWEMGRYKAELVLGYGDTQGRQTVEQTRYFWVIYWQPLLLLAGMIILLIIAISFFIKISIKRSIKRAQASLGIIQPPAANRLEPKIKLKKNASGSLGSDLEKNEQNEKPILAWSRYKHILIGAAALVILGILILMIFRLFGQDLEGVQDLGEAAVYTEANALGQEDAEARLTPIAAEKKEEPKPDNLDISIEIRNGSGRAGVAASAEAIINGLGYANTSTANADRFDHESSAIYYRNDADKPSAQKIAAKLGGTTELKLDKSLQNDMEVVLGRQFE